ncbi:choline kinase [Stella humosa]|uniref:Choline kinase n=1 Tax=Stella humosa TaxID=94 RepID=A0A3N1MB96_9PROT|nr:phosphocholine cytidylyltransferase family protein [Stella humosa]ROQ00335.1 choline kinase [Stella humosa]
MKAIILAAGQGRRLLPLTEFRPKCLVELAGITVLEWQLRGLAAAGVADAVVVTGFGADLIEALLAGLDLPGLSVRTLHNPFYAVADNLASCWIARGEMTGDYLILNGDTMFEPAIARRLLEPATAPITVTIDRKAAYDADDMKVELDGWRLTAIGKTLPAERVGGESIGFLRFTAEGGARFVAEIEGLMRGGTGLKLWYLSVIDRIAAAGTRVEARTIEGLDWAEIDFPADVEKAARMVAGWLAPGNGIVAQAG